jgi:ribonuclease E
MANKMLIDATHPEETRVVVVRENRVEEFDYESASKKQLRGNIYLAKVTRVEPSLQAAFVNYGGNRHGFLPFNEIHPDYYHLPLAERQALKQEEQRASRAAAQARGRSERKPHGRDRGRGNAPRDAETREESQELDGVVENREATAEMLAVNEAPFDSASNGNGNGDGEGSAALEAALTPTKYSGDLYATDDDGDEDEGAEAAMDAETRERTEAASEPEFRGEARDDDDDDDDDGDEGVEVINDDGSEAPSHARGGSDRGEAREAASVESIGSEDALEELPDRVRRRRRNYKIQEVIKRGQILLVQVVKEERGNKGAALTTYLSLAGRYTVLMPNTGSGGGISRKISSPADRKRLREIAGELDVQEGMGLIIRTAGASRTKSEIKRDYEYLLRLWENVRELTLKSSAPCLVYEEGDLIKRSIRDLYNRDIDEISVAGDDAYRDAKDFMRMLMPSHAKNVQLYKDPEPLFIRYEVERQLNAMFSPQVTLPSGGYIVLNQTEALVAIDVNSGKSTREFSIEETALKTNLEASEEIARQLRLRDLAGLIVVDFIDMEEKRNNRAVERKLKECLRNDRARIQVGRISHFGLLEMSRQRLRTGMIEGSTCSCPTCQGTGFVRSTESVALSVLRGLEDWLRTNQPCNLNALTSTEVALYILNQKRGYLRDIEYRYGVSLGISASDRVFGGSFHIEKLSPAVAPPASTASLAIRQMDYRDEPVEEDEELEQGDKPQEQDRGEEEAQATDEQNGDRRSRRRRRRRRGRGDGTAEGFEAVNGAPAVFEGSNQDDASEDLADSDEGDEENATVRADDEEGGNGNRRRSRRRGRRGGRHQRARQMRDGTGVEGEAMQDQASPDDGEPASLAGGTEPAYASSEPLAAETYQPDAAPRTEAETPASEAPPVEAPTPVETPRAEERQEEPAAFAEEKPVPMPATDPVHENREVEAKEHRGYINGNGLAHSEAEAPASDERDAEVPERAGQAAVMTEPPKQRGSRRGWWQRR